MPSVPTWKNVVSVSTIATKTPTAPTRATDSIARADEGSPATDVTHARRLVITTVSTGDAPTRLIINAFATLAGPVWTETYLYSCLIPWHFPLV